MTRGIPRLPDILSAEDMAVIAARATRRRYRDGEIIHERGDGQAGMGVVLAGRIKLTLPCRDGQEAFSGLIHTGQNYGDATLLHEPMRAHRAVAIGATVIDHLDRDGFEDMLRHPAILRAFYVVGSFRLSVALALLDDMRVSRPEVRLARLLQRMRFSHDSDRLEFLQEDFAGMLGVSSVTLAKSLRQLEQHGLVEAGYRHIRIADSERLASWVAEQSPD